MQLDGRLRTAGAAASSFDVHIRPPQTDSRVILRTHVPACQLCNKVMELQVRPELDVGLPGQDTMRPILVP